VRWYTVLFVICVVFGGMVHVISRLLVEPLMVCSALMEIVGILDLHHGEKIISPSVTSYDVSDTCDIIHSIT
jgi:hypothetical protein